MQLAEFWLLEQDPEAYEIIYDLCILNGWACGYIYQNIMPQSITGAASHMNHTYESKYHISGLDYSDSFNMWLLGRSTSDTRYAAQNH